MNSIISRWFHYKYILRIDKFYTSIKFLLNVLLLDYLLSLFQTPYPDDSFLLLLGNECGVCDWRGGKEKLSKWLRFCPPLDLLDDFDRFPDTKEVEESFLPM